MKIPSTYDLKPAFQRLLNPLMEALRRFRVTPNGLTWSAMILSGGLGWAFIEGFQNPTWYFVVVGGLLLRMMLNALDGMMARHYQLTSKGGAVLNELGDVVSDALVMWPLILMDGVHFGWAMAFLWLTVVNEFAGVLGQAIGGTRRYEGPMGKSDRTLIWGILCLMLGFGLGIEPYLQPALYCVLACLLWSTLRRIIKTVQNE